MKFLFWTLIFFIALITGCAPLAVRQNQTLHVATIASGGLAENLKTIAAEATEIDKATKANPVAQAHLVSLKAADTAAQAKVPSIDSGLALIPTLQDRIKTLEASIASQYNDIFGPRTHRGGRYLLTGVIALAIALGVLKCLSGGSTVAAVAYHVLLALGTGGLSILHAVIVWIFTKIGAHFTGGTP